MEIYFVEKVDEWMMREGLFGKSWVKAMRGILIYVISTTQASDLESGRMLPLTQRL